MSEKTTMTVRESAIEEVIAKSCGSYRTGGSYTFEDVWNCIEAALSDPFLAVSVGQAEQTAAARVIELQAEIDRLNAIINTPHADDFLKAVSIEAEHQRQRWGSEHDAGKAPADWFWLVGYLGGKALHAHAAGNADKAEHHIVTTAAACANWHLNVFGKTDMRPGIETLNVVTALASYDWRDTGPLEVGDQS